MKLAVIGGGGVRVPLLVNGLLRRGLPISHVALVDVDGQRLDIIGRLTAARLSNVRLTLHDSSSSCVEGADFVVTSIRVGGLAAREHDERTALARNIVGQETVGPAGFAMAVRTIPAMNRYAQEIAERAPNAWVINFTNPVGIITQAMRQAADVKVIGICDTPTELFAEAAHALGVPVDACAFDYVGLNHLGWLREVHYRGRALLARLWGDRDRLARVCSRELFDADYLAHLRLLPTEYVFYYAFPDKAVANLQKAGRTRGTVVRRLTEELFDRVPSDAANAVAVYERYLAERSASYMQIESGRTSPVAASPWAELTGYDRIAFDVMHAIIHDSGAVIPLNVPNHGNVAELADDDVIEVPCSVGSNGARALSVGSLPPQVRDLVTHVKQYERNTIAAARTNDRAEIIEALTSNPLVPSRAIAESLVSELTLSIAGMPGA